MGGADGEGVTGGETITGFVGTIAPSRGAGMGGTRGKTVAGAVT